jgi:hypothetical protein
MKIEGFIQTLIEKYYDRESRLYDTLLVHSTLVADKALRCIASRQPSFMISVFSVVTLPTYIARESFPISVMVLRDARYWKRRGCHTTHWSASGTPVPD